MLAVGTLQIWSQTHPLSAGAEHDFHCDARMKNETAAERMQEGNRVPLKYLKLRTRLKTADMVKNCSVLKMWEKEYCKANL